MRDIVKFRIVIDTNIILGAGSQWVMSDPPVPIADKAEQKLIHYVAQEHIGLYCGKIMGEYAEKLIDGGHPAERVSRYICYLLGAFTRVVIISKECNPAPHDPDDAIFILCAVDGSAHYIFTNDRHLLRLRPVYDPPIILSCKEATESLVLT